LRQASGYEACKDDSSMPQFRMRLGGADVMSAGAAGAT
jgi:hypothetical protein